MGLRRTLLMALFALAAACAPRRSTPSDLAAALGEKGLHVETVAELEPRPEWVGGELGVDLVLDHEEPYVAVRFSSPDLARAYCQEGQGGVPFGVWCVEPKQPAFRPETWAKVNALRTR